MSDENKVGRGYSKPLLIINPIPYTNVFVVGDYTLTNQDLYHINDILDQLGFCCGRPDVVLATIIEVLRDVEKGFEHDRTCYDSGYTEFMLHMLNKVDLLEHGSTIDCYWLRPSGKLFLMLFNECDDFTSLIEKAGELWNILKLTNFEGLDNVKLNNSHPLLKAYTKQKHSI